LPGGALQYRRKVPVGQMGLRDEEHLNLIQIQKWSFGMWETSPPAAPLLLKERFDKTLVPLL